MIQFDQYCSDGLKPPASSKGTLKTDLGFMRPGLWVVHHFFFKLMPSNTATILKIWTVVRSNLLQLVFATNFDLIDAILIFVYQSYIYIKISTQNAKD